MSKTRIVRLERDTYYHSVSRIVDRRFVFGDEEKSYFSHWMRRLEKFCGVEVATWCLMSNHFHILVKVPEKAHQPKLTVDALMKLLPLIYQEEKVREIAEELERAGESGDPRWTEQILERYEARRFDLAVFIKELKQRFSRWHNQRVHRRGTLWEERYRSVLVEDSERARAGIQGMLADAARGGKKSWSWEEAGAFYRLMLFDKGEEREADMCAGQSGRLGMSAEAAEREQTRGGELSLGEALRCRVRYFSDGVALGSAEFLETVFHQNRERFGPGRRRGARRMRGADWGPLRTFRDLQDGVGR